MTAHAPLSPEHLAHLRESAIRDDVILARGYRSITDVAELRQLGFAPAQCRVPGLLLPLWTTDGQNGASVYRPDNPRVVEDKGKGKNADGTNPNQTIKYELPKGTGTRVDCPPVCRPMLADPKVLLWITEGQKKADALASIGLCAIALLGVWNWKGKNGFGSTTFLNDFDYIAWDGRDVRIVFDSDVTTKPEVRQSQARLTEHLQRRKAHVTAVYLPPGPNGKIGVDDWLAAGHTVEELEALVESPRPASHAAPELVEVLDSAPPIMRRPLALVGGRAYAATWLWTRVTVRESLNRRGDVVRHDPPIVKHEPRLFVVRDDGTVFGEGADKPMSELGLDVTLPEMPPADKLWSTAGMKAYRAGARPDPADVFRRVADVVDRFIDFDRSLADQRVMAEAVACYCLSTWMLDAFSVIGFLWPNGDRGSGKTHLLLTVAELSYLGQVILAGGSFASLRDLADYGATLAFDDAEIFSDPKRSDPDKRALLLAGNRRGTTVSLKELGPDKTWHTRHVNAFCPRLFSAIRLPDLVLASRTIVIPLIRTPDRRRANADPLDYGSWPHDRRRLVNDLWTLALAHLPELPRYDEWVGQNAKLTGRNLQPWRALLAVAKWLDGAGVPGLWQRMESLSMDYQTERPDLETSDLTALVILALLDLCQCANVANCANHKGECWVFTSSQIAEKVGELIKGDSDAWISPDDKGFAQRVGHALRKMRLLKPPRPGGKGPRVWHVKIGDLERWTQAYGVPLPEHFKNDSTAPDPSPGIGIIGEIGTLAPDDADLLEGEI